MPNDVIGHYASHDEPIKLGGALFSEAFASKMPAELIKLTPTADICFNMRNVEAKKWIFQLENGQEVSFTKDQLQIILLRAANGTL